MSAPERIYLKQDPNDDSMWWLDTDGVPYVRADLFDAAKAERDELLAALKAIVSCPGITDVDWQDAEWGDSETAIVESRARALIERIGGHDDQA